MKLLLGTKKKQIVQELHERFGVSRVDGLFLQFGKEKIRLYCGSLSREELTSLDSVLRLESVGLYFAKIQNDGVRLTLEGCEIVKDQITKNLLPISNEDADRWFHGQDLAIAHEPAFKILTNNQDIIGCGKSTGDRITNSLPKERRIR